MDYFCEQCAKKPGWHFDPAKTFQHSCQRCFQNRPCNDYAHKKQKQHMAPAPKPTELVAKEVPVHIDIPLPRPKVVGAPVPVKEEIKPEEVIDESEAVVVEQQFGEAPVAPVLPDTRSEADKALDAVQPNKPGIKLETKPKRK